MADFADVREMVLHLGFKPENVDLSEQLFRVSDESEGIKNLLVDCEDSILVLEQMVIPVTETTDYLKLMQLNRELVHGAFCVDEDGKLILWRDTLRLDTLDQEELAGSIDALSLAMAEHARTLLAMSR